MKNVTEEWPLPLHCSVFCSLGWLLQKPRVRSITVFFLLYFNHFRWFCTFCFWFWFFLTGNFTAYDERAVLLRKWKIEVFTSLVLRYLKGKILVVTSQTYRTLQRTPEFLYIPALLQRERSLSKQLPSALQIRIHRYNPVNSGSKLKNSVLKTLPANSLTSEEKEG